MVVFFITFLSSFLIKLSEEKVYISDKEINAPRGDWKNVSHFW